MKKELCLMVLILIGIFFAFSLTFAMDEGCPSFFGKSLHHTGEGMRYWYEEQNGFAKISGIPYQQLGCKKCHIKSCDKCHAVEKEGKMSFSVEKAKSLENCFSCHKRAALAYKLDKSTGHPDIHLAAGMKCIDCHSVQDVHGDGTFYQSMRDDGAVNADCLNCHEKGEKAPIFNVTLKPHKVHHGKLDCAACHVSATMACYNCHFSRFLKTKTKKGNSIPMKSWLFLINYQGKVTSGSVMTLVYKDKKFIAYVPYLTHSIMSKGRKCNDCHNNKAIQLIKAGEKVPVVTFKDGKIIPWEGVIPTVPQHLNWIFLDKENEKWVPFKGKEEPTVQFAAYGEPLTQKQLKKLFMKMGTKK